MLEETLIPLEITKILVSDKSKELSTNEFVSLFIETYNEVNNLLKEQD